MRNPSLGALTWIFLRLGNLTFGGGTPTMAALQRELVERRGCLSPQQYALAWSLARITPGTNVLAFCAASAWTLRGWVGALIAVASASLPSALLALWILLAWNRAAEFPWLSSAISSVSAAVVGMMLAAALLLIKPSFRPGSRARPLVIAFAALVLSHNLALSPLLILGFAAIAGFLWPEPPQP